MVNYKEPERSRPGDQLVIAYYSSTKAYVYSALGPKPLSCSSCHAAYNEGMSR